MFVPQGRKLYGYSALWHARFSRCPACGAPLRAEFDADRNGWVLECSADASHGINPPDMGGGDTQERLVMEAEAKIAAAQADKDLLQSLLPSDVLEAAKEAAREKVRKDMEDLYGTE